MQINYQYDKQAISIDCVVFGFDGAALKVLLVRCKRFSSEGSSIGNYKLPGSLIANNENLDSAVIRVMEEHIGMRSIYMRQMDVFSDPKRIDGEDLKLVNKHYNVDVSRIITVTYISLVKLNSQMISYALKNGAEWIDVDSVKRLALDHNDILIKALNHIAQQLQQEPIAFELLPKRFTIKTLRTLCEAIMGFEFDSRNFRKKILSSGYIIPTEEKEVNVSHKPALFYMFDKKLYEREAKRRFKLSLRRLPCAGGGA